MGSGDLVPSDAPLVTAEIVDDVPPRRELILMGRASLVDLGVDPDEKATPEAVAAVRATRSDNTVNTRYWAWGRFIWWCGKVGRRHDPPTAGTICSYIEAHTTWTNADGSPRGRYGQPYSPRTVETAVYLVAGICNRMEWTNPVRHPSVAEQLNAYAIWYEQLGHRPDRADAITNADSVAMARTLDRTTLYGLRIATMMRVQFDTGCRAGELCGLQLKDVYWVSETQVRVTFYQVKGRTRGVGPREVLIIAVPYLLDDDGKPVIDAATGQPVPHPDWDVDPVNLLAQLWRSLAAADRTTGPLFRTCSMPGRPPRTPRPPGTLVGNWGDGQVEPGVYRTAVTTAARDAGLTETVMQQSRHISTHSHRAGFITESRDAGVPAERTAERTGHNPGSESFARYYRGAGTAESNPGAIIRRRRTEPDHG